MRERARWRLTAFSIGSLYQGIRKGIYRANGEGGATRREERRWPYIIHPRVSVTRLLRTRGKPQGRIPLVSRCATAICFIVVVDHDQGGGSIYLSAVCTTTTTIVIYTSVTFLRAASGEKYTRALKLIYHRPRRRDEGPTIIYSQRGRLCVRALIACLESGDTRATGKKLMIRGTGFRQSFDRVVFRRSQCTVNTEVGPIIAEMEFWWQISWWMWSWVLII